MSCRWSSKERSRPGFRSAEREREARDRLKTGSCLRGRSAVSRATDSLGAPTPAIPARTRAFQTIQKESVAILCTYRAGVHRVADPGDGNERGSTMSDRYSRTDPAYLRAIGPRDSFGAHLYARSVRSAYIRAVISELLLFVWRHIRRGFKASPRSTGGGEPVKPLLPLEPASAQNEGAT